MQEEQEEWRQGKVLMGSFILSRQMQQVTQEEESIAKERRSEKEEEEEKNRDVTEKSPSLSPPSSSSSSPKMEDPLEQTRALSQECTDANYELLGLINQANLRPFGILTARQILQLHTSAIVDYAYYMEKRAEYETHCEANGMQPENTDPVFQDEEFQNLYQNHTALFQAAAKDPPARDGRVSIGQYSLWVQQTDIVLLLLYMAVAFSRGEYPIVVASLVVGLPPLSPSSSRRSSPSWRKILSGSFYSY